MRARMLFGLLLSVSVLGWAQAPGPPPGATVQAIMGEVQRLQMLNRLGVTADQLQALIPLATQVEEKHKALRDHAQQPEAVQAVWAIRTAFLQGQEPGRMGEALESFGQEERRLEQELRAAREAAGKSALEVLKPEQLALLTERHPEGEAHELLEQINQARELPDAAWNEWAQRRARQIAYLAAADSEDRAKQVSSDVMAFLQRVRGMTDDAFADKRDELRAEAQALLATAQPKPSAELARALAREPMANLVSGEGALGALQAKLAALGNR